ncbi:MAG TPA: helix-hairpin-helix domain-containing protein [Elusimicrobiota bacterium]|nr:helix-hairpin-helix domain-containing protein [Elusimicrobiota bacterium]
MTVRTKRPETVRSVSRDADPLTVIPGVGRSIAQDLRDIGIKSVPDLIGKNPERLYAQSNQRAGLVQDRCLLYVFRCAVYFAEGGRAAEKLKWWNWMDKRSRRSRVR